MHTYIWLCPEKSGLRKNQNGMNTQQKSKCVAPVHTDGLKRINFFIKRLDLSHLCIRTDLNGSIFQMHDWIVRACAFGRR